MPESSWTGRESRIEMSMGRLLDLFERNDVRCTCFVLGKVAEDHPQLVRDIHDAGHEVATHGFSHQEVYDLTPAEFRDEIRRSVDLLEDLTGQKVIGYRAPYFTITDRSLWALDILREEGIVYDSSIHPIMHHRCGIPGADRVPTYLDVSGGRLLEVPVSTLPIARFNLPVGGGTYMRLYPYAFLRRCLKRLERTGETIGIYTHPWEVDVTMPRIKLDPLLYFAHYTNLGTTYGKLDALLSDFDFVPYKVAYSDYIEAIDS